MVKSLSPTSATISLHTIQMVYKNEISHVLLRIVWGVLVAPTRTDEVPSGRVSYVHPRFWWLAL